jgi:hypothetical protein
MNQREFNALLKTVSTGKGKKARLDVAKVKTMLPSAATSMVLYLVRNRGPIVKELLEVGAVDWPWLHACGYLYETKGAKSGYTFRHTCEHKIV